MPSIQNSQDTLDFLGSIGSKDRGDGTTVLGKTAKALGKLAQILIDRATDNLQKGGNKASGETAASMKIVNLDTNTLQMSCEIQILNTYKFLDQGVRGTEGGSGKFSFKSKYPNKKMATAILKWLRKRGAVGAVKYKGYGKAETKSKRIHKLVSQADNYKRLAYAVSTNIKKKGIKPTRFFSEAVDYTKKQEKKLFGDAFKLDIIESINKLNSN